jgi:amidase
VQASARVLEEAGGIVEEVSPPGMAEAWDLLLCPVEAFPAPLQEARDARATFTYTTPFSLVGWPSAVVRAGSSPEGLPIGVQVVAGPWRDDVALAAAHRIEAARGGWQPPLSG